MNYLNQYLPIEVRDAINENITSEDKRNVMEMTGKSLSTINSLLNGTQPVTSGSALVFEKLKRFAEIGARDGIARKDHHLGILSNISDHVAA